MFNNGRRATAVIEIATAASNEIIAAPASGHIEFDHITLIADGGGNTLTLSNGVTAIFGPVSFDDNQAYVFDNASGDYPITLAEVTAFNITLTAATSASGFVLYRVVGEAN